MRSIVILAIALASVPAWAQAYRWVDPATGRSVISDTPPPASIKKVTKTTDAVASGGDGQSYAVRRAAENFPVTLYTAPDCSTHCKDARDLLNKRGVPFKEVMVQKPEEAEELKKLVGDLSVPAMKIGKQSVKGFEAGSYNNLLDMAGYPKTAPIGSKPSGGLEPVAKQ